MLENVSISTPEIIVMLAVFFFAVYVVKKVFSWVFTIAIIAIIVVGALSFAALGPDQALTTLSKELEQPKSIVS